MNNDDFNKFNNHNNNYYYPNSNNNRRNDNPVENRGYYYTYNAQQQMGNNYNSYVNKENITSSPSKEKLKYGKVIVPIIVISLVVTAILLFVSTNEFDDPNKKARTFMIYMVGSDLESKSSQGTYSIGEIVPANIDLENNNIVLMVGGAKKWHNFVNPDEIAIYELTANGFEKKQSNELLNMGDSSTLTSFLDYSYTNYPAKKYDLIFWNHGMGAIGLEHDEVSEDFINIYELNEAFETSNFKNQKLELAIFYNCLTENLQIASVMSKYANYMLGSEEVIYLSKLFNRFSFFEQVKTSDNAYDLAKKFIILSDELIDNYNETHIKQINSTLSFLDLSKIEKLEKDLDRFINSIDIGRNYYNIAIVRKNIYTYGKTQNNNYDTIDLYSLVEALSTYSTNKELKNIVQDDIKELVVMNSSLDDYSYGISTYFPYYSTYKIIETHLSLFENMWPDSSYVSFIRSFNDIRYNNYRSTRSVSGKEVNELNNNITINKDLIELELTDKENDKYQNANIYIFKKDDEDRFELLLKSNKFTKDNNKLVYQYDGLLKANDNLISYMDDENMIYGNISNNEDDLNVLFNLHFNEESALIVETILDSGENPLSSIIDISDYNKISLSKIKYNLLNDGNVKENWKEDYTRENIEYSNLNSIDIRKDKISLNDLYIMIEMYDIDNDTYYTNIKKVEQ